ncbi:MAG: hypothetical protein Q7S40_21645 [Opitutaceae bacterium]|nr:hypothetical protein [Opitutaceae bacterium]
MAAIAEPLSKKTDIDFFRDVPSRNLKGLASRSDGRLVSGPILIELHVPSPADLLWTLEPTPDPAKWLVGTGPDGRIVELTLDAKKPGFRARDYAKLDDPQVFAVKRLPDGSLLAGTSPKGALYLIRDEKPVARALLPVDSIFDLLILDENTALAATGNPGRIYKIDIAKFATVGLILDKITDAKILADRGITVFGEIRDRNVRRIAALADGRIAAGSAPRGNVYVFPKGGGSPVVLQENRDAEVTDLLPAADGGVYATLVFSSSGAESRITPPPASTKGGPPAREHRDETPPPAQVERFGGRSSLVWFPADGFPEILMARASTAFYRVLRRGDLLIVAGGEQGELVGYDLKARLSLTFAGSISSQLNAIAPITDDDGKFLVVRNNTAGFALLDFGATGVREAESRRIDLGTPALLGALRFNRLRDIGEQYLLPEVRTSNGSDEVEGWGPWTQLRPETDGGWRAGALRGRYVKLRLRIADGAPAMVPSGGTPAAPTQPPPSKKKTKAASATATGAASAAAPSKTTATVPAAASKQPAAAPSKQTATASAAPANPPLPAGFEIDRASLYSLPQNRRPQLQDFRVLTPGFGLIAATEQAASPVVSLNRLLEPPRGEDDRRRTFLSSQVVPAPGAQVVLWTVNDPDGDNFVSTFSIRRDGDANWTDVAAATKDSFAQFDTAHLPDGVYFTRLVATETAPRTVDERLSQTFETDDMIIDHTSPEALETTARRSADSVVITVRGRDQLSLLDGIEVVFNNGVRETVEQPADGVRDGREETFSLDVPFARVSNATSVEVILYDRAGNGTARRLTW